MRKIKILGAVCIGVLITVLVMAWSQPGRVTGLGSTWQQPIALSLEQQPFVTYGQLPESGGAVYYRLTVTNPTTMPVRIDIPNHSSTKFAPQLVVFEPHPSTIGPLLPLVQPPQTIALVYPLTPAKPVFDPLTQASFTVRLEAQPELDAKGTYLMAVYNAGSAGGEYRLNTGDQPARARWPDVWLMPVYWWQAQTFVGFSWMTLIFPAVLGLFIWLIYLRLDHHQLHVHKNYPPSAVKKK